MLLPLPDDLEAQALRRLVHEERVLSYLKRALAVLDAKNRQMTDAVQLRMGQGASQTLAEVIGLAEGKASAGALTDTRPLRAGQGKSDTV